MDLLYRHLLLTKHYSGDQIKNEMGRECSMYGDRIDEYRVLVGKPEKRRPIGRLRVFKINHWEVGLLARSLDRIVQAQDWNKWRTLVIAAMNIRVP
jgi:hypothetical protein